MLKEGKVPVTDILDRVLPPPRPQPLLGHLSHGSCCRTWALASETQAPSTTFPLANSLARYGGEASHGQAGTISL